MTPAHRALQRREAAIGAVINGVLSAAFCLLLFHGERLASTADLQRDAFPQTFMVTLMACAVPTLLTRRRVRSGGIGALAPTRLRLPGMLAWRALLLAALAALALGGGQFILLPPLLGAGASFPAVLIAKILYGALLGAAITAFAVRHALADVRLERTR